MTEELRDKLEAAARSSGQSLTREATSRLTRSFQDDVFGGPELRHLAFAMHAAFVHAGQFSAGPDVPVQDWLRQPAPVIAGLTSAVDTVVVLTGLRDADAKLAVQAILGRIATRIATRAHSDE